ANDTDLEGDPLTAVLAIGPEHGSVTLAADGSFVYTPDAGYFGTDQFTYVAHDGRADSPPATVRIRVNDVPVALPDFYQLYVNESNLRGAADGVLANDRDGDGDPLTVSLVEGPPFGQLTLNADGSFSYQPNPGYVGFDRFVYQVGDGLSVSAP